MNRPAPRTIAEYLNQLRVELAGEDPSLIQDALYDAEEYLRSEIAAHPGKSEGDVLELIASTYGAPDEVAAAYRDTEAKVKAALATPRSVPQGASLWRRFFAVYSDPRAWSSLFFLFLCLATGIFYFTFAIVGVALSAGLAILIIGIPFFLTFIGLTRVLALGEGRLIEAITGERMPRRPQHPGAGGSFWQRIGAMLRDPRTWTTVAYFVLMLPLGVAYFLIGTVGTTVGLSLMFGPLWEGARAIGLLPAGAGGIHIDADLDLPLAIDSTGETALALVAMFVVGLLLFTVTLHAARGLARRHAGLAKALLVMR